MIDIQYIEKMDFVPFSPLTKKANKLKPLKFKDFSGFLFPEKCINMAKLSDIRKGIANFIN